MFRSHRHSFGRAHTVVLTLLAAGLLSTSVGAAAAPDRFVLPAVSAGRSASVPGAAPHASTRLLGRITHRLPTPGGPDTRRCLADALTRIAGRSGCEGASEDLAPQAAFGTDDPAATQGHRDVPHPQRLPGERRQTDTAE
jgi:hypothetical protein